MRRLFDQRVSLILRGYPRTQATRERSVVAESHDAIRPLYGRREVYLGCEGKALRSQVHQGICKHLALAPLCLFLGFYVDGFDYDIHLEWCLVVAAAATIVLK